MKIKFNVALSEEDQEWQTKEYQEFVKENPMTKKERKALLDWVKDGWSVYDNGDCRAHENGQLYTFLENYRCYDNNEDIWEYAPFMRSDSQEEEKTLDTNDLPF